MNSGKTVFTQLLQFLPSYELDKYVIRYQGNYKVQTFSCWDQFLCMSFAQLTYRESLRDIETCLNSHRQKLYHIGFHGQVSKSTLTYLPVRCTQTGANETRDFRIYQDLWKKDHLLRHVYRSLVQSAVPGI